MNESFPQRKRLRLPGFDYRTPGAYFVTICAEHRVHLFGHVDANQMHKNAAGRMIEEIWSTVPDKFPDAKLDEFVVMPNHIHLLLWVAGQPTSPPSPPESSPVDMMRWFKSLTTARYRHGVVDEGWMPFPGKLWQRSYYDRIVRTRTALDAIRTYIRTNPARWRLDFYNADRHADDPLARSILLMTQPNQQISQ